MSIEYEYLPLLESEMPCSKIFTVENPYTFLYRINTRHNRIYCEIRDVDNNVIYTTRLIYFGNLIHAVVDGLDIGENAITCFNIDDLLTDAVSAETEVTPDSLERIKQYVITG